ncbi:hypothetical protein GQ457_04G024990 [Hibiscus cannabinus]
MSEPPVDPCLPKKHRRRDESPPDPPATEATLAHAPMDCEDSNRTKPQVSYKDILTSSSEENLDEELLSLDDDDDNDLLDDDISSMDYTLVVKILGRQVGYNVLHNRIHSIWKPAHPLKLIDIENDYFLVKFSARSDYIRVLSDGPWTIFGHYLKVEPWSIDFNPWQAKPSRTMAWVRLSGLPITWYKRSLIEAIGSRIGSVIKIDYQTDNGSRGRFARMAISINMSKPLVSKIVINGLTQIVEYESLPIVCFNCGIYGHASECCPKKSDSSSEAPHVVPDSPATPVTPQDPYVEKRQCRPPKKLVTLPSTGSDFHVDNSRFNPIFLDSNNDDNLANTIETPQVLPQAGIPTEPTTSQQVPCFVPSARGKENVPNNIGKKHTALLLPMMAGPTIGTDLQPPKNWSDNPVDMAHTSTIQLRLYARSSPTGNNVSTLNGSLAMIE